MLTFKLGLVLWGNIYVSLFSFPRYRDCVYWERRLANPAFETVCVVSDDGMR